MADLSFGSATPVPEATGLGDRPDVHSTADYILDMSTQLAKLAADARLDLLAYLLDMVRLEAELVRDRPHPAPKRARHRA